MERLTIEYCGGYMPREMCSIDRNGDADDCDMCMDHCKGIDEEGTHCHMCAIRRCFCRLGTYENAQEKIEKRMQELKASPNYPHHFLGQMVEDLEWMLSLFREEENHEYTENRE